MPPVNAPLKKYGKRKTRHPSAALSAVSCQPGRSAPATARCLVLRSLIGIVYQSHSSELFGAFDFRMKYNYITSVVYDSVILAV
jgi:hypothetical protein